MGQLTLNIVAITIFLATMGMLLGPLLNISQTIPVLAIAALLGVATVDQTNLNGTLGNLFIDSLKRLTGEERDRIVHHEAGHFLVAHLLDIPVQDYTLSAWEAWRKGLPGVGGVQFDTTDLDEHLAAKQLPAQTLDRYCTIWMAGIAAETLAYGQARGGQDDRQKFSILWQQLQRPIQEGQMRQRWALLQAQTLLENHSEAYEALVKAMGDRASTQECIALLEKECTVQGSKHQ